MIVRMSKIEVIGPRDLLVRVLGTIRQSETLQIDADIRERMPTGAESRLKPLAVAAKTLGERLFYEDLSQRIERLLSLMPVVAPRKTSLDPARSVNAVASLVGSRVAFCEEKARRRDAPLIRSENVSDALRLRGGSMEAIGFIGLGRMGRPMASNLCRKGLRLVVHDVNPAPVADLAALGARAGASAAGVAAAADIVFTMLPDSTVGRGGGRRAGRRRLAHARPGTTIVDMSTIDPLVTDRLAAAAGRARPRLRRRAGRPAGEPRRSRRVAVHGRRRTSELRARRSRCSAPWARRSTIAAASAPGCAPSS